MATNTKKRHFSIRKKISGTAAKPRLSVFRSLKGMYVQLIDDEKSVTLLGMSDKSLQMKKGTKREKAYALGKEFGAKAKDQKITAIVFDRGGNKYHGRVAEFARGAREAGLVF